MVYDYDLIVIGGGSGGLAAAKEAKRCGAEKVCLFDFVKPSSQGTKWGLGGTCVNVGCVPKKLFHYAARLGAHIHHDLPKFGYNCKDQPKLEWSELVQTVQNHVKSLNFGYKNGLRSTGVEYINALAKFTGPNSVTYETAKEGKVIKTAKNIIISVGGRPAIPQNVPGAQELAITSDDIFSQKQVPGKTLIVGASYIALECGGFLTELGYDVTICVRSIFLRGFDQQCANKIGGLMEEFGTKFLRSTTPKSMRKNGNGQIEVEFNGAPTETFDTVLYATGRHADTDGLDIQAAGLKVEENGKFKCVSEKTNVPSIFAIGDCLWGGPELTPVAIMAGERLARRLMGKDTKEMNYHLVPTAVFTPVEYGCCGLSEEAAMSEFGEDVETFLFEFTNLEVSAAHREKAERCRANEYDVDFQPLCLSKLICRKSQDLKVIGFHFVGPNAGEITQGMALAVKLGAKKSDFDEMVGIHPTDAEAFCSLSVTKASGESWVAAGGCGGGKCG